MSPDTIVVIEDNPDELIFLNREIQKAQLVNPVRILKDGAEAIILLDEMVRNVRTRGVLALPLMLILEIELPKYDGFEVLRRIQSAPELSGLVTVVLSTLNSKLEIAKAYQLGARSYLVKPPRAVDLKAIAIAAKELTAPNAEGVDGAEATLAKRLIELDERLTLKFLTASSTEADLKSLRVACYAKEIAAWMDGH